jgi:hypothetical protein
VLRIKPEQMEHFANKARDRFSAMMVDYIAETYPERAPAERSALAIWVKKALAVCEQYGIIMQLFLVLGVDAAEREEWVRDAIAYDVAPVGKVRRLVAACRERELPIDDVLVYEDMFRDEGVPPQVDEADATEEASWVSPQQ